MNKTVKFSIMAVLAATLGLCASFAQAQSKEKSKIYVTDDRGVVVRNAVSAGNLCWRTNQWTAAAAANDPAGCECDKDLLPKASCEGVGPGEKPRNPDGPKVTAPVDDGKITISADALFDFNKATLRPMGKEKLNEVAMKAGSINLEVVIAVGHADRIGSAAYNQKLSEKRAAAVKTYLVSKGIPANRVYTEGKGSKQPVTQPGQCKGGKSAKVIACLQPDRRVDIEIIGTSK